MGGLNSVHWHSRNTCRSCGNSNLMPVIEVGAFPIADALLESPSQEEATVPLSAAWCGNCLLMQIREDIEPAALFPDSYPYFTSANPALVKHFQASANELIEKFRLNSNSFVIEIASNDGTMLKPFKNFGIKTLGVEPAGGPCSLANENGIETKKAFFSAQYAGALTAMIQRKANLVLANNVLAHVPNPMDFVNGISLIMDDDASAVIEVPHVMALIDNLEFDTIIHQHYSYFSLHSMKYIIDKYKLFINDVQKIPVHGGSLRVTFSRKREQSVSVAQLLTEEEERGLNKFGFYEDFGKRANGLKIKISSFLNELKDRKIKIAAYGAAGKGNTMVNFIGIDKGHISCIGDISRYKQGKYFPGIKVPIVSPETMLQTNPEYILILAWNFADDIIDSLNKAGYNGKYIIPIPEFKII